jgi:hypothetical protein
MEKSSFEGEIQIDKVVSLFNDFKKALYNVNYMNKLISLHANNIIYNKDIRNGYSYILTPPMNQKYLNFVNNTNDNINRHDFYISSVNTDKEKWDKNLHYYLMD